MKIERIELREVCMPLVSPFETSFGRTTERRIMIVRVWADGEIGYGECTASEFPFYNHESIDTAWIIIRQWVAPMILSNDIDHPSEVSMYLSRIRGNKMARAAVETAIWELYARQQKLPLSKLIGGTLSEIPCGVSIGIQESIDQLLRKVETELAAGYQRIKIKIRPGLDIEPIAALRRAFPDILLMADANSAYTLKDIDLLRRLDDYNLMMIEQPLAHDDIIDHAELQSQIQTPICLDESILSVEDARKALAIGACRIINIKLGRVGGHQEAKQIHNYCQERGVPVWCGGMLESGVGRAHNIALSSLAGFVLPGDVSASKRYWQEDIIEPPVEVTPQGTIIVPSTPGLGYQVNEARIDKLTVAAEMVLRRN
ncbi:MAG: o-succinylbenzoate synthase [Acidobacteriota bacterium]